MSSILTQNWAACWYRCCKRSYHEEMVTFQDWHQHSKAREHSCLDACRSSSSRRAWKCRSRWRWAWRSSCCSRTASAGAAGCRAILARFASRAGWTCCVGSSCSWGSSSSPRRAALSPTTPSADTPDRCAQWDSFPSLFWGRESVRIPRSWARIGLHQQVPYFLFSSLRIIIWYP